MFLHWHITDINAFIFINWQPKTKGQPFSDRTQEVLIAKKSMQKVRNEQAKELKKAIKRSEDDPSNIDVRLC